jgi:hypothetical protein
MPIKQFTLSASVALMLPAAAFGQLVPRPFATWECRARSTPRAAFATGAVLR